MKLEIIAEGRLPSWCEHPRTELLEHLRALQQEYQRRAEPLQFALARLESYRGPPTLAWRLEPGETLPAHIQDALKDAES